MAVKNSTSAHAKRSRKKAAASSSLIPKFMKNPKTTMALALLIIDSLLVSFIIVYVPYTKIDWDAHMSQVSGFLGGERDYKNLKGDTGPLVYPAGFLYVYSAIQYVTGGQVFPAQILFGILYIINLGIVLLIYVKTNVVLKQHQGRRLQQLLLKRQIVMMPLNQRIRNGFMISF
ncbi:hypothetical protein E1A91_A12G166800v1 [Gossypium mustelinum]|uniref:dolichyl-P-Man:Man5GlcNAc2-PP-dolichol alpha-1,3-mannosyltransferase n=3 Tax=Gossypium TaxID=3633 RepID=A0A5D2WVG6_GOSMU|nr:hypothetical protein E1A91_A12G166800v1 [Gossypium mustelinum]